MFYVRPLFLSPAGMKPCLRLFSKDIPTDTRGTFVVTTEPVPAPAAPASN